MGQAGTAPRAAPWTFRFFEAFPISPVLVGIGAGAALLAAYFGTELALGRLPRVLEGDAPEHFSRDYRTSFNFAIHLAYILIARLYLARWTEQSCAELRPLLAGADTRPVAQARAGAGLLGIAVTLFVTLASQDSPRALLAPDYWVFPHAFNWLVCLPIGWQSGQLVYALLAVVFVTVITLHAVNTTHIGVFAGSQLLVVGVGAVVLLLPMRGIHRRIRSQKRDRLAEIRAAVRADAEALRRGGEASASAAVRLPASLALEARIASVREWPFDASTLARFALYAGVGVGSWIGAAAVERFLDPVLRLVGAP